MPHSEGHCVIPSTDLIMIVLPCIKLVADFIIFTVNTISLLLSIC